MAVDHEIRFMPLDKIYPYANNARTHSTEQVQQIAASMREWGVTVPILIDEKNMIIAGHGRAEAAKLVGLKELPAIVATDWTEAQKKAYVLADNQLALNAGWNDDTLRIELQGLDELDFDLDLIGFENLDALMFDKAEGLTDPDEIPENVEPVTKPGDLWICGNHRILCGDSTKAEDVERLVDGQKCDLLFTSPPYAQQRDYKKEISDWDALMNGVFANLPVKDGAQVLVNLGMVHNKGRVNQYWDQWLDFMDGVGWPLFGWYVWDQGHGMPGNWNGRLAPSHEFIFHFARNARQANKWIDKKPENVKAKVPKGGEFRQKDGTLKPIYSGNAYAQPTKIADSVIRVNRAPNEAAKKGHPAMFPVALCEHIYNSYAKAGDIIYEPFCGGGTAVVACEQFGAHCYAMEISPEYVDIIVTRWQNYTGEQAVNEQGEAFGI